METPTWTEMSTAATWLGGRGGRPHRDRPGRRDRALEVDEPERAGRCRAAIGYVTNDQRGIADYRIVPLASSRLAEALSDIAPGSTVVAQEPAAGTELPLGSAVDYIVSLGSAAGRVERDGVVACLAGAGLDAQDPGILVSGNDWSAEAIVVPVETASRILLFVLPENAPDWAYAEVDWLLAGPAAGYTALETIHNVKVAYQATPSDVERAQIERCLSGS